jgi:type II restriction/modification system DNA methylase subunit YeeA
VLGIELNEYAAELARVTVWIGELQWRIDKGYAFKTRPVLEPLDHIECRDAVLGFADDRVARTVSTPSPSLPRQAGEAPSMRVAAVWPAADAVIGNPPFVGDKKMRGELGDEYTEALRAAYKARVPGGADLVCYWFEKARAQIEAGALMRAGLVSTQAIRNGSNRSVLDAVVATMPIFDAWADEPWINDGAAVRVSMVAFGKGGGSPMLGGQPAQRIGADLTAADFDLTTARALGSNLGVAFQGPSKVGAFDLSGVDARRMLMQPSPDGRSNAIVVRPWFNGSDITDRAKDHWIIDFGAEMPEAEAALYESPFGYVVAHVKAERLTNNREAYRRLWYRFAEARSGLRRALGTLSRFIVSPRVSKHRVFAWLDASACTDTRLYVIARSDDACIGILHSRVHEVWSLANASMHGVGNDPTYNAKSCFETFPFPAGLTPADTAHQRTEPLPDGALIPADLSAAVRPHALPIARAAKRLADLRDAWLNPPEWTERVPEVVPLGMDRSPYPDRIVAKPGFEKDLAQRTLTQLYNQRPAWLAQAHATLDAAVAAAYGWADWSESMADDEILRRLLALNRERSA